MISSLLFAKITPKAFLYQIYKTFTIFFFFIRCHEKCKNGYVRDPETEKCQCGLHCAEIEGICECLHKDQRIHGLLIQNDTSSLCTDNDGTSSKTCSCLNGFYTSNGTCVCANGYKMRDGFVDLCEPQCENECVGGVCIEPNECQCENGYELGHNKNETNICYPICKSNIDGINGCGNGTCIAPNTCKCDYGFENHVKGNYACTASALTAERQKAETNWLVLFHFIEFFFFGVYLVQLFTF